MVFVSWRKKPQEAYATRYENSLFVALQGENVDGNAYIDEAIERGAVAVVSEQEQPARKATNIVVKEAMSELRSRHLSWDEESTEGANG